MTRWRRNNNYPCKGDDSWVAIAVRSDSEWARLCQLMGHPELASDARFHDLPSRLANVRQLDGLVSDWTKRHTADHVTKLAQAKLIPCAPVYKSHEMPNHPQLESRGFFQSVTHPDTGDYPYAGVSWEVVPNSGQARWACASAWRAQPYRLGAASRHGIRRGGRPDLQGSYGRHAQA